MSSAGKVFAVMIRLILIRNILHLMASHGNLGSMELIKHITSSTDSLKFSDINEHGENCLYFIVKNRR